MKVTLKTGIIFALIWIIFKLSYHLILPDTTELTVSIFVNMFLLISAISFGLYFHKKKEGTTEGNALSDIKAAMSSGVPYSVLVAIFMFLYYNNINPQFIENVRKPKIEVLNKELSSPKYIAKLKRLNPELETKTKAEIYQAGLSNINAQVSPKSTAILSILGMIFLSTIYSILVTVIFRKILFKRVN